MERQSNSFHEWQGHVGFDIAPYPRLPMTSASRQRVLFDMRMRARCWDPKYETVVLPTRDRRIADYWCWYASKMGKKIELYDLGLNPPSYSIDKAMCLCHSGGIESMIGQRLVYGADIVKFTGLRDDTTIEGQLAMMGAGMGYACTVVGVEETSTTEEILKKLGKSFDDAQNDITAPQAIEQTDDWLHMWNIYAAPCTVQSFVCVWHKDELLKKLHEKGDLDKLESCFNPPYPSGWCGKCYKCFVVWCMLKALRIDFPKLKVTQKTVEERQAEFRKFLDTGYDPHVSCGLLARLTDKYGLNIFELRGDA